MDTETLEEVLKRTGLIAEWWYENLRYRVQYIKSRMDGDHFLLHVFRFNDNGTFSQEVRHTGYSLDYLLSWFEIHATQIPSFHSIGDPWFGRLESLDFSGKTYFSLSMVLNTRKRINDFYEVCKQR